MKRLIIGDIHGCYRELLDLLDRAGLAQDDEIIAIGDIIDRGPDSAEVYDFFRRHPGARTIMGNHESKHLSIAVGELRANFSQLVTRSQIGVEQYAAFCDYLGSFPAYLELPDALLVHAFLEPGRPLEEQKPSLMIGRLSGKRYIETYYGSEWYRQISLEKPLIVGHRDYSESCQPFVYRDKFFGLDTGACRGGCLAGLILPDFQLITVPSRADYAPVMRQRYGDILIEHTSDSAVYWHRFVRRHSDGSNQRYSWAEIEEIHSVAKKQVNAPNEIIAAVERLRYLSARGELAVCRLYDWLRKEVHPDLSTDQSADDTETLNQNPSVGNPHMSRVQEWAKRCRSGEWSQEEIRGLFPGPEGALRLVGELGLGHP